VLLCLAGCGSAAEPVCGNGVVEEGEVCDDGEASATCDPDCTAVECGDQVVNAAAGEACDDGNTENDDACNNFCVAAGATLWTQTYNGPASLGDEGRGIAADPQGNVLVVGWITTPSHGFDIWVRKYDPQGGEPWTRTENGALNGEDVGFGVASDADGNVLATGYEQVSGQGFDVWVRKYDPDGATLWTQTYGGVAAGDDAGEGIATDARGDVLVAGYETVADQGRDVWVRKYDPDGGVLWTATQNGAADGDDWGLSIAVDAPGNVLVAGAETVVGQGLDIWARKYDADGNIVWTQRHDGAADGDDAGRGIATDPLGNVLVAGYETVPGEGASSWLTKYDADGATLWTRAYGGLDAALGVACDGHGNVLVAGYQAVGGEGLDGWAEKYDPDGNALWTQRWDGAGGDDTGYGIAADAEGNVLCAGAVTAAGEYANVWVRKQAP
jgi:uncharacterized delta-60 repeat protein